MYISKKYLDKVEIERKKKKNKIRKRLYIYVKKIKNEKELN